MKIGEVHDALQSGKLVRRPGWPVGEFLFLVPGSSFVVNRAPLLGILPAGTQVNYRPHIDRHYSDGSVGTYNLQDAEILAGNWEYYTPPVVETVNEVPAVTLAPTVASVEIAPVAPAVIATPVEPVAPTPIVHATTPAEKPAFVTVWLIEIIPTTAPTTPEYWSATEGKFIVDANVATPYVTMQDALTAAKVLAHIAPQRTRIIHHSRAA